MPVVYKAPDLTAFEKKKQERAKIRSLLESYLNEFEAPAEGTPPVNIPEAPQNLQQKMRIGYGGLRAKKGGMVSSASSRGVRKFKDGDASMKSGFTNPKKGGLPFEMSTKDVEKSGMKEGSKQENFFDKMQMKKKPVRTFSDGGNVDRELYDDKGNLDYEGWKARVGMNDDATADKDPPRGLASNSKPALRQHVFGWNPQFNSPSTDRFNPEIDWDGTENNAVVTKVAKKLVHKKASAPAAPAAAAPKQMSKEELEKMELGEALEGSHPEKLLFAAALPAMYGMRAVAYLAKALANKDTRKELKLAGDNISEGVLSAAGRRAKEVQEWVKGRYPGRDEAVMNPLAWMGGPKAMDKIAEMEGKAIVKEARAAAAASKKVEQQAKRDAKDPLLSARPVDAMLKEMRKGPKPAAKSPPKPAAKSPSPVKKSKPVNTRKWNAEGDETWPPMYKKGGTIKKFAKGGLVSSASSRGDGIAQRGKTRGRIY